MVKISAGDKKKALILKICKKLFYKNGVASTTYADICEAADTSPGSVSYHFQSKDDIAIAISQEFREKLMEYIFLLYGVEIGDDPFPQALLNRCWWEVMLGDEHIRVFYRDVFNGFSGGVRNSATLRNAIRDQARAQENISDEKLLRLIVAYTAGKDCELQRMICELPNEFTPEELFRYDYLLSSCILGSSRESCSEVIEQVIELFGTKSFDIRYFRGFRYDKRYLPVQEDSCAG